LQNHRIFFGQNETNITDLLPYTDYNISLCRITITNEKDLDRADFNETSTSTDIDGKITNQ